MEIPAVEDAYLVRAHEQRAGDITADSELADITGQQPCPGLGDMTVHIDQV